MIGRPSQGTTANAAIVGLTIVMAACAPAGGQGPLVRTEGWRHLFEPGAGDPGVGVVMFGPAGPTGTDTIALFRRPGDPRPAGYVLRFTDTAAMAESYLVAWPESLTTNLLEVGYEIPGLPADSAPRDDGWVAVIPGFTPAGAPVRAWARAPGAAEFVSWRTALPEHDLYFRGGARPEFFAAPDGPPAPFPLPAEGSDYILHPLEARGDWLRVRAVTPSDFCADPATPVTAELWVRYLEPDGRPRVWYFTRGC